MTPSEFGANSLRRRFKLQFRERILRSICLRIAVVVIDPTVALRTKDNWGPPENKIRPYWPLGSVNLNVPNVTTGVDRDQLLVHCHMHGVKLAQRLQIKIIYNFTKMSTHLPQILQVTTLTTQ